MAVAASMPANPGRSARQQIDEILHTASEVAGILAERHPENPVVERVLDVLVVAERAREHGLAIAAGGAQRCGDGHRLVAHLVEDERYEALELHRPRHEVRRQIVGHERHPALLAARAQVVQELRPLARGVVEMDAAHPSRQHCEVDGAADHGIDAHAVLARVPPLLAHERRLDSRRGHDEDHELDRVERRGDLQPPVAPALHVGPVLP